MRWLLRKINFVRNHLNVLQRHRVVFFVVYDLGGQFVVKPLKLPWNLFVYRRHCFFETSLDVQSNRPAVNVLIAQRRARVVPNPIWTSWHRVLGNTRLQQLQLSRKRLIMELVNIQLLLLLLHQSVIVTLVFVQGSVITLIFILKKLLLLLKLEVEKHQLILSHLVLELLVVVHGWSGGARVERRIVEILRGFIFQGLQVFLRV